MTDESNSQTTTLTPRHRLAVAALGLALLVPLLVAVSLEPAAEGHGTHQQLGLPPCTFYVVFGWRCPTCGMTTSWAHLVRGQVVRAVEANLGGTLLAALAMIAVPWLLWSAARGRWLGWVPTYTAWAWILASAMSVALVEWGVRFYVR